MATLDVLTAHSCQAGSGQTKKHMSVEINGGVGGHMTGHGLSGILVLHPGGIGFGSVGIY